MLLPHAEESLKPLAVPTVVQRHLVSLHFLESPCLESENPSRVQASGDCGMNIQLQLSRPKVGYPPGSRRTVLTDLGLKLLA